jgi:hypothetical protein
MRKIFFIMTLSISTLLFSSGCTRVCTREFLLHKESREIMTDDWQFNVELYAYRMIASGGYPDDIDFDFTLHVINHKAKKTGIIYDIDVDSVHFGSIPPAFNRIIITNINRWLSYQSEKYLLKYIYCLTDPNRSFPIGIPQNIDTLVLDFDAILKKGTLSSGHIYGGGAYTDSIIADTSSPEIRQHVQLKLVRHEVCPKYPFFVKYFN